MVCPADRPVAPGGVIPHQDPIRGVTAPETLLTARSHGAFGPHQVRGMSFGSSTRRRGAVRRTALLVMAWPVAHHVLPAVTSLDVSL